MNNIEQLKQYKELLDQGVISQEEFDTKKAELLATKEVPQEQVTEATQPVVVNNQVTNENTGTNFQAIEKRMNKHLFVWLGTFVFGFIGVDRFMRGQVGLGIVKIFLSWLTLGIWPTVDWIIGLVKVYGSSFSGQEEVVFINGKYAR